MLESAEALLQLRRCSAPLVGQEQAGAQPACSGSVGTHSLPKELAQKANQYWVHLTLVWWPLDSVCLLLCWWP